MISPKFHIYGLFGGFCFVPSVFTAVLLIHLDFTLFSPLHSSCIGFNVWIVRV